MRENKKSEKTQVENTQSESPNRPVPVLKGFAPIATRGGYHLMEAVDDDAHRQVQQFIGEQFRSHYAAEVPDDTPRLLCIFDKQGELTAAFGIRTRADGFFSEHYLGAPLETALLRKTGEHFDQTRVVEVGHFAIAGRRAFAGIVPLMAEGLSRLGFEHVVCTATRCLVRYFARRYLTPMILTEARVSDLPESQRTRWGSYYLADPAVAFGPIAPALNPEAAR